MQNCCGHTHQHCQSEALQVAQEICQQKGARFTAQRQRVFEILWQSHKAMTAAEVMAEMENKQPPITYRALDFLKEVGLIHHVASLNAFIGCVCAKDEGHIGQLLICTECKLVQELEPKEAMQSLNKTAQKVGFQPRKTYVEMLGLCADCQ